jgi:hypothetical protein
MDIPGMTEEDQLEVYRATVDLVKNRIGKAESLKDGLNQTDSLKMGKAAERMVAHLKDKLEGG